VGPELSSWAHSASLVSCLRRQKTYCLPPVGDEADEEENDEEAPRPSLTIPEDLDSREAMVSQTLLCLFFPASLPVDTVIPWFPPVILL
jgi:hypothetical protein